MIPGIDASFSRIDRSVFARFRDELGVQVFVQNLWTGGYKHNEQIAAVSAANLRDAAAEGLAISGYINANPWWSAAGHSIPSAIANAGEMWDALDALAIDVEISGTSIDQVKAHVSLARDTGKRTCIYSAHWVWSGLMGNPQPGWITAWGIPLWNAYYDKAADIDFSHLPYGPWVEVVGEQYSGDVTWFGADVDLNVFKAGFWRPQPPVSEEPEPAVLPAQVEALGSAVGELRASLSAHEADHLPKRGGEVTLS